MQAVRFTSAFEWGVAALFLFATLVVGSLIVRELRTSPLAPIAEPAASVQPAAVPARAISVPVLMLFDGKEIRVGDTVDRVTSLLGTLGQSTQIVDRGALGDRLTRSYEHAGTRFVLVFEPFERRGAPRVAAIYIQ